jgi:hypothetical protein
MSATLTMLVSFDGDGDETVGDLIADANGRSVRQTSNGGAYG